MKGIASYPVTLAVGALCAAAFVLPGSFESLAFQRDAAAAGELWRLWTASLAHGSASHMAWSVITFLTLGQRLEPMLGNRRYAMLLFGSATAVGGGVFLLLPDIRLYSGISGVDTALYAYLVFADGSEGWRLKDRALIGLAAACAAALAAKILYEYATGDMLFATAVGMVPVPAAHLIGAMAGLIFSLMGQTDILRPLLSWADTASRRCILSAASPRRRGETL